MIFRANFLYGDRVMVPGRVYVVTVLNAIFCVWLSMLVHALDELLAYSRILNASPAIDHDVGYIAKGSVIWIHSPL